MDRGMVAGSKSHMNKGLSQIAEPKSQGKSISRHWKLLFTNVVQASTELDFKASEEVTPRSRLVRAKHLLQEVMSTLKEQNITRISRMNVRNDVGFIINRITGIRQGLIDDDLSEAEVQAFLDDMGQRLKAISDEIVIRYNQEIVENKVTDQNRRHDELERTQRNLADLKLAVTSAKSISTFDNMQTALQQYNAKKNLEKLERDQRFKQYKEQLDKESKLDPEVEKTKHWNEPEVKEAMEKLGVRDHSQDKDPLPSQDTWVIRDETSINTIVRSNEKYLNEMRTQIDSSGLLKSPTVTHTFLRGPVLFLPESTINEEKLKNAGLRYTVVSSPGVRLSSSRPGTNYGGKAEYIVPMLILYDQVLVAFGKKSGKPAAKVERFTKSGKKISMLPSKKSAPVVDNTNIAEMRNDVCEIQQIRTGRKYIDVMKEVTGNSDTFIRNTHFPNVRMIWLLPQSIYTKIGPFTVKTIGLSF